MKQWYALYVLLCSYDKYCLGKRTGCIITFKVPVIEIYAHPYASILITTTLKTSQEEAMIVILT